MVKWNSVRAWEAKKTTKTKWELTFATPCIYVYNNCLYFLLSYLIYFYAVVRTVSSILTIGKQQGLGCLETWKLLFIIKVSISPPSHSTHINTIPSPASEISPPHPFSRSQVSEPRDRGQPGPGSRPSVTIIIIYFTFGNHLLLKRGYWQFA